VIIKTIRIHNYRSIRDLEILAHELVVFLGPNNHGKSNVLGAIEFALTTSAKVDQYDFFCYQDDKKKDIHSTELWIELAFDQLSDQEKKTFEKYIRSDGSFTVRKFATIEEGEKAKIGYRGYIEEPEVWWLKANGISRLNTQDKVQAELESVPQVLALLEGGGRITKNRVESFQRNYIQEHRDELVLHQVLEESQFLGTKNVGGGVLPDFYLVPAVRDATDEIKVKSTTVFGRLLHRSISEMTKRDARFVDALTRLAQLIGELNERPDVKDEEKSDIAILEEIIGEELKMWGVEVAIRVDPPEAEKIFELGTQLLLNDGLQTNVERKGHGLQRALIFALLRTWANTLRIAKEQDEDDDLVARKASESVIFAIEEPEMFLHPHAQRQLADDLKEVASAKDHQVFVCSHSTHFVNLDEYHSIAIVTKNDASQGTILKQCATDLFEGEDAKEKKDRFHMAYWINPDRGELFFGRKVVLVEGETEKATLPFLATKIGCYDPGVSIIDCGSKHNLPLYLRILNAYDLHYLVIHDEDPLPDLIPEDWGREKIREKRRTFALNTAIADMINPGLGDVQLFSPDFEGASGISKSQGKKMGKATAALEHFSDLPVEEIPESVVSIVRAAFC